MTRTFVAGIDGCRAGWVVVLLDVADRLRSSSRVVATFAEVLALPEAPRIIAVDIPIGLAERTSIGGRRADIEARQRLGARQSAVFSVPPRAAVMETDYVRACEVAQQYSDPPRKVSKQAFHLFPKIREVDRLMTPALQQRVFECHPEGAFVSLNGGQPLALPKKVKSQPNEPGLALRRQLLIDAGFPRDLLEARPGRGAGRDDLLDACACAWTASRILGGLALRLPPDPPLDAKGLRQEIWA